MFADIEADFYVLVDGDDTYDAGRRAAHGAACCSTSGLDMVNGTRVTDIEAAYRPGHRLGNQVLTGLVRIIFGNRITDMLSGYRVFSRRFVKSFPALSAGFETETEFTVHALELRMPVGEIVTRYKDRPAGSTSKLRTYSDGMRILRTIVILVKEERPLAVLHRVRGAVLLLVGFGAEHPGRGRTTCRPGWCRGCRRRCWWSGLVLLACAVADLRADPRFRGARPQGDQAAGLSRNPRAAAVRRMMRLLLLAILLPGLGPGGGRPAHRRRTRRRLHRRRRRAAGGGARATRPSAPAAARSGATRHDRGARAARPAQAQAAGLPDALHERHPQPRGGPMAGVHASHMLGLDADVWLDVRAEAAADARRSATRSRWTAWSRRTGAASNRALWTPQHVDPAPPGDRAARAWTASWSTRPSSGSSACTVTGDRSWLHLVRPWYGHTAHMHIHFRCPPDQPECRDKAPPPPGDGCDAALRLVVRPARRAAEAAAGAAPVAAGRVRDHGRAACSRASSAGAGAVEPAVWTARRR